MYTIFISACLSVGENQTMTVPMAMFMAQHENIVVVGMDGSTES